MISKSATNRGNCSVNASFTVSARAAWGHIIRSTLTGVRRKVLLPAYIGFTDREGSGVFDPVRVNDCDYAFYKVDARLGIDMDDFRARIEDGVDLVLVIHYFGFSGGDMTRIRSLCDGAGAILVEDCAHAFHLETGDTQIGKVGDYAFYSLHKYIATESGGMLKVNRQGGALPPIPAVEQASRDVIEQYALTRFDEVRDIRRANYQRYLELLGGFDPIVIMHDLGPGDIPQTFPIRIKGKLRERLYFFLMERGVPTTALYYRMIDQIDQAAFPESFEIASDILNLPVHQDTTLDDVREVCEKLKLFFDIQGS